QAARSRQLLHAGLRPTIGSKDFAGKWDAEFVFDFHGLTRLDAAASRRAQRGARLAADKPPDRAPPSSASTHFESYAPCRTMPRISESATEWTSENAATPLRSHSSVLALFHATQRGIVASTPSGPACATRSPSGREPPRAAVRSPE